METRLALVDSGVGKSWCGDLAIVVGMALGGWMSGAIDHLTRCVQAAFDGSAWNLLKTLFAFLRPPPRGPCPREGGPEGREVCVGFDRRALTECNTGFGTLIAAKIGRAS